MALKIRLSRFWFHDAARGPANRFRLRVARLRCAIATQALNLRCDKALHLRRDKEHDGLNVVKLGLEVWAQ